MSIISDDGVYSWDGEKWVEINHENEEEEVFEKQMNESNIEMKERQEMLSNLEEHYELG